MDFGIIFILMMGAVVLVVLALLSNKPKREMSGAEKMSYEQECGRLQAQSEFDNRRNKIRW